MNTNYIKFSIVALCTISVSFFVYFPITDTDIFWHLAAGREMVLQKHFLFTDPFSFTNALPQWINLHWIFQLLSYALFHFFGLQGLIVFKICITATTFILICFMFPSRLYTLLSALGGFVIFYHVKYLIFERPTLITMILIAIYLFLFEKAKRNNSYRLILLCIPLQIIWTNSQGLFPLGIFIVVAYWLEALTGFFLKKELFPKIITFILCACIAACFVNPYGIDGALLSVRLFKGISPTVTNMYSHVIAENIPLFALTGFEATYRITVIVTALLACVLFFVNRQFWRIAHIVLFLGFLYLAYSAVRNVLLYAIVIIPILAYNVSHVNIKTKLLHILPIINKRHIAIASIPVLAYCTLLLYNHISVVSTYPPHRDISPFRFPEKIVEYLHVHKIPGEMFNDMRYGGYCIWNMYPQNKVFIDGRLIVRSPEFFAHYLAVCKTPELFRFLSTQNNITYAILPFAIFNTYHALIQWLYISKEWHLEYTDGSSCLFVKNSVSDKPAIDLSDTLTVGKIKNDIRSDWKNAPYVCEEALGYFDDMRNFLIDKK